MSTVSVNYHKISKDIWDRIKLLMQGTSLSKQERECKLYDEFDKFSYVKGETLHQYYLRNVTDVKLARDLNTSNYDQLYAYLEQHEAHANEARLMRERFPDPLALVANYHQPPSHFNNYHSQYTTPQVIVQQVQGRQGHNVVGLRSQGNASGPRGNTSGQAKVVKCYNCQGKGHMARQCTQQKRRRDASWFKDNVLLIQVYAEGKELDEEQLAFLVDPGVADGQVAQTITHNAAFQTDDLDAYDFDCDDISSAKAVLMANLSSFDSDVLLRLSKLFFGVNLLMRSRGTNLYTLSIGDMMNSSPICLLSKAFKTKSWLWHRHLSHLNFGTINQLAKQGIVRGLPKLKFEKDHLCYACSLGKSKKHSHKPKSKDTNQEKLYLLHMVLCGPMHVESINGKKYILAIVDDYSRFTWVKFLRSKDEAPEFIIKFLKMIQVRLNATVRNIRTDNGTEFVNQTPR
ncbi:retrovirus-related pol polyprotein from transposon TNT 1-94, partial [Tanacetum coccineum]